MVEILMDDDVGPASKRRKRTVPSVYCSFLTWTIGGRHGNGLWIKVEFYSGKKHAGRVGMRQLAYRTHDIELSLFNISRIKKATITGSERKISHWYFVEKATAIDRGLLTDYLPTESVLA